MNPQFRPHPDAVRLAAEMRKLKEGDLITYEQVQAILPHRDIKKKDRHIVASARKLLHRDDLKVFESVTGKGYKLCTAEEIADIPTSVRERGRRANKRALLKLATIDTTKVSAALRQKVETEATVLATLIHFSEPKCVKVIGGKVADKGVRIDATEALKLFSGGK